MPDTTMVTQLGYLLKLVKQFAFKGKVGSLLMSYV